MSDLVAGDTVYVVHSACSVEPLGVVRETVVETVIPGYGIVQKIGDQTVTSRSEDVFTSHDDAIRECAVRLRSNLSRIVKSYEARISELESQSA